MPDLACALSPATAVVELHRVARDHRMGEVTVPALRGVDLSVAASEFIV